MFSHSLLFLLIIFVGHCYAKFPISSVFVPRAKPPFCHAYSTQQNCLSQQISSAPKENWCIWAGTGGCFWNVGNIGHFYCRFLHGCNSPFCRLTGIDECEATSITCLEQTTPQNCSQHPLQCRWYSPGETADNPNFPVCGNRVR